MVFNQTNTTGPVDCPRCGVRTNPVKVDTPKGRQMEVDACPQCHGLWLDTGELKKVLGDRKLSDHLTKEIGIKTESPLLCPRDGGLMDIEIADEIEVDVCLKCFGVWLDSGELAGLHQLSEAGYGGDPDAKLAERLEEIEADAQRSTMDRFFHRLKL